MQRRPSPADQEARAENDHHAPQAIGRLFKIELDVGDNRADELAIESELRMLILVEQEGTRGLRHSRCRRDPSAGARVGKIEV